MRIVRQRLNVRKRGGYRGYKKRLMGGLGKWISPSGSQMHFSGPGLLPMRFTTNQVFNATGALTTAGGFYDWVFRGNSVYDPDATIGGTTASGFDAMSRIYTWYKIYSSTIQVTVVNNDSDDPIHISLIPNAISASYVVGDVNDIPAQPYCRDMIVTNQVGEGKLIHYAKTRALFSVRNIDDVAFDGTTTGNPTNQWYWHMVVSNRSTNALACEINIKISYKVTWYGLKALTQTH